MYDQLILKCENDKNEHLVITLQKLFSLKNIVGLTVIK